MRPLASALGLLLALAACGSEPAFDIELVPDPNLATNEQLAARIGTVIFVADTAEGLYAPGAERSEDDFQVKDADSNPDDLELVIAVPVEGGSLPTLRIERGGLPDVPVDVLVRGVPLAGDGALVASGSVRGLRFAEEPEPVTIPFDPRDDALPPRVQDVLPEDGSTLPGCRVASLAIVFTRPVNAASLAEPGAVRIEPDAGELSVTLDAAGLVANIVPAALEGQSESLSYKVIVESSVIDLQGQAFDQVPRVDGAQRFEADFHQTCGPPPTVPDMPCGAAVCPLSNRMECVDAECVLLTCSESCPDGTVCDPLRDRCLEDCRLGDAVADCEPGQSCDVDSGLCR